MTTRRHTALFQKPLLIFAVPMTLGILLGQSVHAQDSTPGQNITIGVDASSSTRFGLATNICTIFKRSHVQHGYSCAIENAASAVETLEKLRVDALNFALVQSDVLYYAVHGYGPFKAVGPNPDLRTVATMHTESLTVLARADAHIATFDDLRAKRVSIGTYGSGRRALFDVLMLSKGGNYATFGEVLELTIDEQSQALCDGKIDAAVYVAGHPNAAIRKAADACPVNVVDITGPAVDRLVATYPYFERTVIAGGTYTGTPTTVHAFGVAATLVSSTNTPESTVFDMTKFLFKNFSDLKFSDTAMASVTPQSMTRKTAVGIHGGAAHFVESATFINK